MGTRENYAISAFGDSFLRGYELGHRIKREKEQDKREASFDDLRRTNAELETEQRLQGIASGPVDMEIKKAQLDRDRLGIRASEAELGNIPINQETAKLKNQSATYELEQSRKKDEEDLVKKSAESRFNADNILYTALSKMPDGSEQSFKGREMEGSFLDNVTTANGDPTPVVSVRKEGGDLFIKTEGGRVHKMSKSDLQNAQLFSTMEAAGKGVGVKSAPVSASVMFQNPDGSERQVNLIYDGEKYTQIKDEDEQKTKPKGVVGINEEDVGNGVYYDPETQTYRDTDILQGRQVPSGRVARTNKHGVTVLGVDSRLLGSSKVEAVNTVTGQRDVVDFDSITPDGPWVSLYDTAALKKAGFDPVALASDMVVRRGGSSGIPVGDVVDERAKPVPTPPPIGAVVKGFEYIGPNPADPKSWRKVK